MLKDAPLAENERHFYFSRTTLKDLKLEELAAYMKFQEALSKKQYLVHFDPRRQLYINIDASKERGRGAIIFYLKAPPTFDFPSRNNIEPIMLLYRLLTLAEIRY